MRISILLAAILTTFALIQPVVAQTSGATVTSSPGKVEMAQTIKGSAVITAIDAANRTFHRQAAERRRGEDHRRAARSGTSIG